ncbi:hypothetical protein NDU88_001815 [Pleurodeles waltl]|uniref:Reverse transcriptase n=1 Tax=Pleurodeles waltl TaxID=8319 RepID=A0AAV7KSG4_PLEWA|nr:hypothetical protein NDU88_001815 [Pleurodeles waltl]
MYYQVRHWVLLPANRALIDRPLTPFEKWLFLKKDDKRIISKLYRLLQGENRLPKSKGQLRWERELERELSDEEWDSIFYRIYHTAYNAAGTETSYKIASYWYYTPARLHAWDHDKSDLCWRGCGATGTLLHLLWHCPKLHLYWENIIDDIDAAFQVKIPRLPSYILLGLPNPLTFPLRSLKGRQMALALNAALQLLLALWGTDRVLTRISWLQKLWFILAMEKLTLASQQRIGDLGEL